MAQHGLVPVVPRAGHGPAQGRETAETVNERALHLGRRERLMRVLAMQVDEALAGFLQLGERRGSAVDPGATPALAVQRSPQEERTVGRGEIVSVQPLGDLWTVVHVEGGGQLGPVGARPQLAQLETIAQQQRQSVEQDRLACTRLSGQHRETGIELEVECLDNDEIADGQESEHAKSRSETGVGCATLEVATRTAETGAAKVAHLAPVSGPLMRYLPRRRSGVSLQCSFSRSIAK